MTEVPEFSISDVSVIFATAMQIIERMAEAEVELRKPSSSIPKSVLCCDEAMLMVSAAMMLSAQLYPSLLDPETLMQALRGAGRPGQTIN